MQLELGSSWALAGLLWTPGSFAGVFMQLELDAWAPAGLLQTAGGFAEFFHVVRARLLLGSCWASGGFAGVFDAVRLGLLLGSCWAPAGSWQFCRSFSCSSF